MQRFLLHAEVLKTKGFGLEELVGIGSYSQVYSCRNHPGGRRLFAAKLVDCGDNNHLRWAAENEIEVLSVLGRHKNVIKCHAIVRTFNLIITILDYVPGSSLHEGIVEWPSFNENDAMTVTNQILNALQHCHKKNIVHRDIHPRNILWVTVPTVENPDVTPLLKLIDFNLARRVSDKFVYAKPEGDTTYMAPECLSDPCLVAFSSDIWSVGVILYTILAGYPPFLDYNYKHLLQNIIEVNYALPDDLWNHVTPLGIDFVKTMLIKDYQERWSARECLGHDWLSSCQDGENKTWPAKKRLNSYLENREQLRLRSSHHEFNLQSQERKAFIPDEDMFTFT